MGPWLPFQPHLQCVLALLSPLVTLSVLLQVHGFWLFMILPLPGNALLFLFIQLLLHVQLSSGKTFLVKIESHNFVHMTPFVELPYLLILNKLMRCFSCDTV